jgi:hypothetical protein
MAEEGLRRLAAIPLSICTIFAQPGRIISSTSLPESSGWLRSPDEKKGVPAEPARHEACKGICFLLQTAMMPALRRGSFAREATLVPLPQITHEIIIQPIRINVSRFSPNHDRDLFLNRQQKSAGEPHITGRYEARSA